MYVCMYMYTCAYAFRYGSNFYFNDAPSITNFKYVAKFCRKKKQFKKLVVIFYSLKLYAKNGMELNLSRYRNLFTIFFIISKLI